MGETFSLAVIVMVTLNCCHGDEHMRKAVGNIKEEVDAVTTTVQEGEIPDWLDGNFIRQGCAAFGEVESVGKGTQEEGVYNFVDHLFDCIHAGTGFKLKDGEAKFTNKIFPTAVNKVFDDFNRNMNDSRQFWRAVLGVFDYDQTLKLSANVSGYVTDAVPETFPGVTFWQVGDKVLARTEDTRDQVINVETMEGLGEFPYTGAVPGAGPGAAIDNPAHEQVDPTTGDLWSMVGFYRMSSQAGGVSEWVIYKVSPAGHREIVTRHKLGDFSLADCQGSEPYPDLDARFGYIHAFGMSENYLVIPSSSWLADQCSIFIRGTIPTESFYGANFNWYENHQSSLIIIRKSDGQHMGTVRTDAFFSTHTLNTYEKDGSIIMDILRYEDPAIYTVNTRVGSLISGDGMPLATLDRLTINLTALTVTQQSIRKGGSDKMEFPQYNQEYNTKPYTHAYFVHNPYAVDGAIVKINVDTGDELTYDFPSGVIPYEPWFVPAPDAQAEDDGVLLIQATDANSEQTWMVVLDAKTLTLKAKVVAPNMSLVGLHNKYYSCPVGGCVKSPPGGGGDKGDTGGAVTQRGGISLVLTVTFLILSLIFSI